MIESKNGARIKKKTPIGESSQLNGNFDFP